MQFGIISLFPEMFAPYLELGVIGKACKAGLIDVNFWNPRDFTLDRHKTVDDRPYGGGPGMLMKVQPLQDAIDAAKSQYGFRSLHHNKAETDSCLRGDLGLDQRGLGLRTIYLSPQGQPFDHAKARELAEYQSLLLVCGRYEGVDQRLIDSQIDEEISIGDYVLSGGELASMVVMDAIARLVPGVLGHKDSAMEDSFANGLLDHPHFTRPEVISGMAVPDVLLSGDHEAIRRWRLKQSLGRTWLNRPELLKEMALNLEQQSLLQEFIEEVNR